MLTVTSSEKLTGKMIAGYKQFMRTEGITKMLIRVEGSDEEMVIEVEQKDAEGRTLLHD